ncbi:MAG: C1 family peptidase [Terriglobia bacterium]|jgi:C1A family cysteine protease
MHISVCATQSAVKNQHDRPTCVPFAVTALHEYTYDVLKGLKKAAEIDLSEEFLYYHCKQRDGLGAISTGTTMFAASASLAMDGQSLEGLCPYQLFLPKVNLVPPTDVALADGKTRLLLGLQQLNLSLSSIRDSLRLSRPAIAVLDWYSNAYLTRLGRIEVPRPTDRFLGRHAVLIVGLEEEPQTGFCMITFKNSWGAKWGDRGFGYFGLDYFSAYAREIWGLTS